VTHGAAPAQKILWCHGAFGVQLLEVVLAQGATRVMLLSRQRCLMAFRNGECAAGLLSLLFIVLLASVAATQGLVGDSDWPPWDCTVAPQPAAESRTPPPVASPGELPFDVLMSMYKGIVSPVAGKRCPMYPSCSTYANEAFHRRGIVPGFLMACDRLHRCGHDLRFYELVYDEGRPLRYDPVEAFLQFRR